MRLCGQAAGRVIRVMPTATVTVCFDEPIATIRPELHGQFAEHLGGCVYGGLWVGPDSKIANDRGLRSDVLDALQKISVPVIRWPGGCFADDYHWEDGIGPPVDRPRRFNAWWGHDVEDNSFGTHEFLRLCELLGAKPYLAGNVGSGTPRELKQWVEYCNFPGDTTLTRRRKSNGREDLFDVQYWGVGNESWGCGGNMCPEDYAAAYKRYATFVQTFARTPTKMPLFLVACGPNGNDADWTRRFFKKAGKPGGDWALHGYAAHYYSGTAGTATEYDADQWLTLLHKAAGVEKLVLEQRALMDEFDPRRNIGLIVDEWGTWHPATPGKPANHLWQQNTLRDALVAAISLDVFHRHADKVVMANIAQIVNVLQSMILTEEDRMLLTPTYHVFDLYQSHQGGTAVRLDVQSRDVKFASVDQMLSMPAIAGSASVKAGRFTLTLTNAQTSRLAEVSIDLRGRSLKNVTVHTIADADLTAHNTFDQPGLVVPAKSMADVPGSMWTVDLPPASVNVIHADL
jgi:alpha-N-arabinofuranosidase